jgi:hypothetical protein
MRVFVNRVLRRIFGPEMDEVTGEWRKLQNGELHNLYCIPIGLVVRTGKLGECLACSHRWEDNIKMDLRATWWQSVD